MALRILKSDQLGRDVRSRGNRNSIIKGDTPMSLFLDNASPTQLSVSLLTPEPGQELPSDRPGFASDAELAIISDRRVAELKRQDKLAPNQEFRGWAVISVEDAEQNGRIVRLAPLPGNQQHTNIILPAEAKKNKRILTQHARELAKKCKWRSRPET